MSYDLYFRKKNNEEFSQEEFNGYFSGRENYNTGNGQAFYGNEDTGVYFVFEYNDLNKTEEPEDSVSMSPVSLSINYLRPHVFALEAIPEVRSFIDHFKLLISDPQNDGNPTDIFNAEDFIRGWDSGNRFSYGAIGNNNPKIKDLVLPAADIRRNWKWNFQKAALQSELGEDIFMPKIVYVATAGIVKSAIVWSEAIPTAFPEVDMVLIFRRTLAPKGFFSAQKDDFTLVDFSQISQLLSAKTEDSYRLLRSETEARKWVSTLPRSDARPEIVSPDRVLDKELF